MLTGLARLILSSYLIIFLIGGGRVCGCEALSWIGVNCHKSCLPENSEGCRHHHHHRNDDGEENRDHSDSGDPESGDNCCEQSLKLVNGEIPKHLILPEISCTVKLAPVSRLDFNPSLSLVAESQKRSKQLPSHIPNLGVSRLFQQRFNV